MVIDDRRGLLDKFPFLLADPEDERSPSFQLTLLCDRS